MCVQYHIAVAHISGLCIFQIESINAYYKQGKLAKFRFRGKCRANSVLRARKEITIAIAILRKTTFASI